MTGRSLTILLFTAVLSVVTLAQESQEAKPDPSPTPSAPIRRRTFDQFDLKSGIGVSPRRTQSSSVYTNAPAVTEYVDEQTYGDILRLVDYSSAVEKEYLSGSSKSVDPSHYYAPDRVLYRKLAATFRMIEIHRIGLLENQPLKEDQNLALLKENQNVIRDMMGVLELMSSELSPDTGRLRALADRYLAASPTDSSPAGGVMEKQSLLRAMFARLNGNFANLKNQLVIAR